MRTERFKLGRQHQPGSFPIQQSQDAFKLVPGRRCQPAIVAHPLKRFGQHVLNKSANKLVVGAAL